MAYGRNGRVISDSQVDHPLDKKLRERIEKIRMTAPIDKYSTKGEEKISKKNEKVNQNFHFNFRVLPVVVLVALLVLVIKIPNIYTMVEGLLPLCIYWGSLLLILEAPPKPRQAIL